MHSRQIGRIPLRIGLLNVRRNPHALRMFMVNEAEAAAIRQAYEESGEFAAAIELRRYFPGIRDNANARLCARTIASWSPLPPVVKRRSARKRRKAAA